MPKLTKRAICYGRIEEPTQITEKLCFYYHILAIRHLILLSSMALKPITIHWIRTGPD